MGKSRQFSPDFKAQVALELVSGRKSLAELSREHQIRPALLSRWKAQFLDGAHAVFEAGSPAEEKRLRKRIADLERLAAKQALHLEIAEETSRLLKSLPPEDGS